MADRELTAKQIRSALMRCFAVNRPAFIWGAPGIGKSELVEGITKELGGVMYDLRLGQMEPTDIRGIPFYNKDNNVMDWAQPIDLPNGNDTLAGAESIIAAISDKAAEAQAANPGLKISELPVVVLFLDEMNSAPPSVLAAAYQLILNRRIGKYRLPDNVVVVAAGNRESDKGVVFRMPSPLSNRFVHFEMKVHFDSWLEWAVQNKVHEDVVGYLSFAKGDLHDFDPKSSSRAFATPRSWVFVSQLIEDEGLDHDTMTNLVAGTIGEGMGLKFMAHRKFASQLPSPTEILTGKVKTMKSKEISAMYSLVISMCYELNQAVEDKVESKEFHEMCDNFFRFMMDNFATELVVMGGRIALAVYELPIKPMKLKTFKEFHEKYGTNIVDAKN